MTVPDPRDAHRSPGAADRAPAEGPAAAPPGPAGGLPARPDRPRPHEPAPPRRGGGLRRALLVLLALVLVLALAAGAFAWLLGRTFDERRQTTDAAFPAESVRPAAGSARDRGTTVLVLGADQRPEGQEDPGVTGERADSIMLLHVPEEGGEVFVMSLLRDTWVSVPGVGEAKLNAALDAGGLPLMVRTVEDLVGVRVDEVAEVDFEGFAALTDAVGGVTVDVPQDFVSNEGMVFEQGPEHMDGRRALEFVRERKAFAEGDYARVVNQRTYVAALLDRLTSPAVLLNPLRLHAVVHDFSPYLLVSEGLDAGMLAGLAPELVGVSGQDVRMFTAPTLGIGTSPDGQSVVLPDLAGAARIGDAVAAGELGDLVATLEDEAP
ncbi:LCP family protein [Kocuria sp. LUK]|uniref:LCP family protein n=1 Tax=Kocuria TaxID=57493 RepID=UPI001E55C0C0|nr:LCP family protein [Kocuria sp. LUK]MCD1143963.1 LCP family protein [Kocuria sp. LUK]